ncbi:MAG: hypothetical protein AAF658_07925 [Myxococcota bacterium]
MNSDVRALPVGAVDVDTAVRWVRAMTARGVYSHNTGRMRATALEQLASMLEPDENRDAEAVLERLDVLARHWAAERMRRPETASAYLRRARAALRDFLSFRAAPGRFRPTVRRRETDKAPARARKRKAVRSRPAPDTSFARDCPLGDGRVFRFEVPEGWQLADVERVIDHLATLASDYRSDWRD